MNEEFVTLSMTKFVALNVSVSEDGFIAGVNQSESAPLGSRGELLHTWAVETRSFKQRNGFLLCH